jgi:hypothetical protein
VSAKPPLGADLVIPALALAFAIYFLVSIADLAWEAKANGILIGTVLIGLIAVQLLRIGLQLARGEASLRADPLWLPRGTLAQRVALVAVTALFIGTLHWLGLTLGLLLAMFASLRIMGVRKRAVLIWLPLAVAASAYLLFIFLLQSDIPHGPIEKLLS